MIDRSAHRARTDGATGTGTGNLDFGDANKTFPTSGYLLVDKEIIGFTGVSGSAFTGVTRGELGTTVVNHLDTAEIVYMERLIHTGFPLNDLVDDPTITTDTTRIYNVIRDSGNNFEVSDAASIRKFGKRVLTLDLGLTRHDEAWTEHVFQSYLEELKDPQYVINFEVVRGERTNGLDIGQIVGITYAELVYAGRIVSIRFNDTTAPVQIRTV